MKRWYVLLLSLLCLITGVAARSGQSAPPLTYQQYDAAITLRADGTMLVREIQTIRFDDTFQSAFAEIPTELTTNITAIQLYEGAEAYQEGGSGPGSFTTYPDGDLQVVEWNFTPTSAGDVRTFVLEYVVEGGLWLYPDAQVLEWRAVPAERSDILVEQSTVTVTLPSPLSEEQLQYTAYGPAYQSQIATTPTTTQILFQADEALPEGMAFQVQVGLPPATVAATRQPWQVREDEANLAYTIPHLDVTLTFDPDGTLWVAEQQQLAVTAGALDQGYRTIPLALLDGIDQITLAAGDQPFTESSSPCDYCFQVSSTPRRDGWVTYDREQQTAAVDEARAGQVRIDWQFPPLVRGEEATLTLRYRAVGALQLLADTQQLNWTAVFPEREAPVAAASVTLQLPPAVDPSTVQLSGGTVTTQADGTLLVVAPREVAPGQNWSVYLAFPAATFAATTPSWQAEYTDVLAQAEAAATQRARLQLGFGFGALLLAVVGLLGVYLLWYNRGRDLPIPAIADYLTEPPSELPPAIVAYLLDETPSTKGALASLFHLATLGLLAARFDNTVAFKRLYEGEVNSDGTLTPADGALGRIPNHLATLFNALKPELPPGEEISLARLQSRFQAILPQVYAEMGTETTRFFDELPTDARQRWLGRGQWTVLLSFGAALILGIWYSGEIGLMAVLPALALLLVGIALIVVSRWMPRRTNMGVEEAQRWRAFRTYLRNLKQYASVDDAQRILDRYFAYAVALDVEEVVLAQAEALGGRLPPWSYTPTWQSPRRGYRPAANPPNVGQSIPGTAPTPTTTPAATDTPNAGERPSLNGMSRQMGNTLSSASSNLGSLLSQAAPTGPDTPFASILQGTRSASSTGASVAASTLDLLGDILSESSTGGGGGGYSSSGSSRSSWGSSSSRSSSSRSSSSSSSSSSRRSGGGGRRGFR